VAYAALQSKRRRLALRSASFNAKKPAILNIAWGNLGDLTKRWHLSAQFGLKYLSNDGINHDRFHSKNVAKIYTFGPANKNLGLILKRVSL